MLYILSSGEYSNYSIIGLYEGPEGIDIKALARQYAEVNAADFVIADEADDEWMGGLYYLEDDQKWFDFIATEAQLKPLNYVELDAGSSSFLPLAR